MKLKLSDIAVLIVALFFLGLFELFPRPGWVDPGIYTGYAINPDVYKYFPLGAHSYQGSRLGYILPLQLFSHFFGDIYGRAIYALASYFAYLSSVTLLIQIFVKGQVEKVLLTILFVFNPVFISSIFYGGADGPAAVQLLVAIALIACAARSASSFNRNLFSFLAGLFLSLSISSHIFVTLPALLIVPILLHFLAAARLSKFIILGGVITTSICAFFGFKLGLSKFYLFYSLPWAAKSLSGSGQFFIQPRTYWFGNAVVWLPVILTIILFSLINRNRVSQIIKQPIHLIASFINLVGPLIAFIFFDVWIGGSLLSTPYYFNIVFPCFVVGTILMVSLSERTEKGKELRNAHRTGSALAVLVSLSIVITFTCTYVRSVFAFNAVQSRELYASQISFVGRLNHSDRDLKKLRFIYVSVGSDHEFDARVYNDYFKGTSRAFDYVDSLTALFLWDRTTSLRITPSATLRKIDIQPKSGDQFVLLGRSQDEVQRLIASLSLVLGAYSPEPIQCYSEPNYPWCYIEYKK